MRTALIVLAAAPFALAALPAQAQSDNGDLASAAIVRGDLGQAERQLTAELRSNPSAPELLLNLAAIYASTGRSADARILYRQVLSQKDVEMDVAANRVSMSHAIANQGLQRVNALQLTSR
ncbi:tetratricopeptide repeat protein [Sphingomonas sp. HITSZ_GF]|uniref:tetratricopeptide repeat protein n=1 Tax=Sphingomonas sp. HITSZ_GF TaxID=3037247 RepID=UPI00240E3899|nr:tetratricopeptide repeat protein [Sphingomonas sp. HITSZ_GF]MDG2533112.1 tetratricopeptide repeat protein [Sphingomonas sp. HITSZ_GF]